MKNEIITLPFDVELLPVRELRAGTLLCLYEHGNLRAIRIGNVEIVRMIYGAVRDANWQTAPYQIQDEKVGIFEKSFSISYVAFYQLDDIRYKAHFQISGDADNTITFHMRGEALSSFQRNRIGLCLLHPIKECAGKEVLVQQENDSEYTAMFPEHISPHQPFVNIRKLHYTVENLQVQLQFEGDIFETEDQRNWTDSSYKTYSTPLCLPFPVLVEPGETIAQSVTLRVVVDGERERKTDKSEKDSLEQKVPFPMIGFSRNPEHGLLKKFEIEQLKKLPFHHYRVELHLAQTNWEVELEQAAKEAGMLDTKLELVLFFTAAYETESRALITQLQLLKPPLFTILLLWENEKVTLLEGMQKIYPVLKQAFSNTHIGYGTGGNFADLNRNRPGKIPHDFLSFSLYPQVHASDTRSVLENLETQHHTLQTIKTFSTKPVHVSPLTFAGHQNTVADPRQYTAVAAWWTLKTVQNLGVAASLTFYQTTGRGGVLDNLEAASNPFSIYQVLARLKAFDPVWVIQEPGADAVTGPVIFENKSGAQLLFRLDAKSE